MADDKLMVLVASYDSLAAARKAVQMLIDASFIRDDIGLAAKEKGDGGLVAVTVTEANRENAGKLLSTQNPVVIDRRDVDWRAKGWEKRMPDADDYIAVDLT
jgi:hypothetical protein